MPIYPGRRPNTYRVTVYAHGHQHEEIVEGTKADAKKHEARMRLALAAVKETRARSVPTFSAFSTESYEPHARAALKDSTWKKTRRYQVAELAGFFGDRKIDALSDELVTEYVQDCVERGFSPGYINALLVALRAMTRWGREERKLPFPPLKIKRVPDDRGRVKAWSHDEVRRLYTAAAEVAPFFSAILHFLLDTGMRKGEAIAAEWSWVDLEFGLIRIPVTEHWQPKDKEPREVPISDVLRPMLAQANRSGTHIFLNQYGVPYAYFPHDAFWRTREAAGVTGGIHIARHTYASHFLRSRPDLPLLARVMGHSTTHVTELYTHLLPDHLEKARNAVQLAPPSLDWSKGRPKHGLGTTAKIKVAAGED